MKHVVITGAAGFIGSHLCEELLKKGYAVTGLDNFVTGRRKNLVRAAENPNFQLIEHDVSRPLPEGAMSHLSAHGLNGVFHFACPASPVDFDQIPFEILEVDSYGTFNTMDLCLRYDARYVLASTSEVYGDPEVHPQTENYWGNVNSIGHRSCYDETKRFAEACVSTAARGIGKFRGREYRRLNSVMVRIFNTYGPRMRADDGRVVPEFCVNALKGLPLILHGGGKQTRSFCFVTDLVDGILRAFENKASGPINLGNPIERSIEDFARIVRDLASSNSPLVAGAARPDDPRRRCPDISLARKLLDWEPRVSVEDGLKATLEYFRSEL